MATVIVGEAPEAERGDQPVEFVMGVCLDATRTRFLAGTTVAAGVVLLAAARFDEQVAAVSEVERDVFQITPFFRAARDDVEDIGGEDEVRFKEGLLKFVHGKYPRQGRTG